MHITIEVCGGDKSECVEYGNFKGASVDGWCYVGLGLLLNRSFVQSHEHVCDCGGDGYRDLTHWMLKVLLS